MNVLTLFLSVLMINSSKAIERPIIGILAQEIELDDPNRSLNYTSYLAAAYVKAVEASGARVVPVFIRRDFNYYQTIAQKLNGFLYTGGNSNLFSHHGVARSGKLILDEVLKLNAKGINIPILGVCQGFELLVTLSNNWNEILTNCSVENQALNLKFVPDFRNSSLYKEASDDDIYTLANLPSTSNHHGFCLTKKNLTYFNLTQWNVLSYSVSEDGFPFVSSMEWANIPISAIQFHPEKSPYEWKPEQVNPHDAKSIKASRLFYDWLVAESRLNNNSFNNDEEEMDSLIYNYSPIYTGIQGGYDLQNYYFNDPPGNMENDVHFRE